MKTKKMYLLLLSLIGGLVLSGCGPKGFVRGSYDEDVNQTNLLTDKWSESDMQAAVNDLVKKASNHYSIRTAKRPPVVMVTRIQNKTSEHIDTQSVSDMLRVELMNSTGLQFVDKAAREDMAEEYKYQNSGTTSSSTRKQTGGQIGADFILNGRLDSIVQQAGKNKSVYYKLTLNMTNLKTGIIVWSGYKQIRKLYKKQRVGL